MSASIAILAEAKGDVNAIDSNGRSPLHFASRQGHTWAVDRLIHHRADVNVRQQVFLYAVTIP
jgi:ankyrin repeat protein